MQTVIVQFHIAVIALGVLFVLGDYCLDQTVNFPMPLPQIATSQAWAIDHVFNAGREP